MKAAIIGGSVIGGGWAARFLLSGWNVSVIDPDIETERKVSEILANAKRSLPALSEVKMPPPGQLRFCQTICEAVDNADWIQESIPERLDIKQEIFTEIQTHCNQTALIGSSTSSFRPTQLQEGARRPEQIFVAHPINPVYLLPLVEIVGTCKTAQQAQEILTNIGMKPLIIRGEADPRIATRFHETIWREALWLVENDIATTQEIDDAICFGFGLRWAQMGLFETCRIASGEAGIAHFIEQFDTHLSCPWAKPEDAPELTDKLINKIVNQSDRQSKSHSTRDLERVRDDNLVSMLRSLKPRGWGAGALLVEHDRRLAQNDEPDISKPIPTVNRMIPIDWTDYNGHMNESRYGQVFSDGGDEIMKLVGADQAYIKSGFSYFTVENNIRYLNETYAGEMINVRTQVLQAEGKKLRIFHEMMREDGKLLSTCNQLLIHVSLETRRSILPPPHIAARLAKIHQAQKKLPLPAGIE